MHVILVYVLHTVQSWLSVAMGMYLKLECMRSQIQRRDTANLNSQPGHPKGQAGSGSRARPGSGTESICHRTLLFTPGVNANRSPDGDGVTNQIRISAHGRHSPHSSAPPSVQMTNA